MLDVTNKKQGFYLRSLVLVADLLRAIPETVNEDGTITYFDNPSKGNLMASHSYGVVFEYLLQAKANAGKPVIDTAEIERLTQENTELQKRLENLPTPSNAHETLQLQEKINSLTLSNTGLTTRAEQAESQYQQMLDSVSQRDETIQNLETQVRQLTEDVSNCDIPELEAIRKKFEKVTAEAGKPKAFTLKDTYASLVKLWKRGAPYPG